MTTDMDGLWCEQKNSRDNFSETKHSNSSVVRFVFFFFFLSLSKFWCVMAVWHKMSFNQAFMKLWFECLSFRDATVLALPAMSSVLPDCCKKRLCDYSTSDWNAPSVKTSACADTLALNKYRQLQMPLPTSHLRGFNNYICVMGPDEEKSCFRTRCPNNSFSPLWRCEKLHKHRWSV